MHKYEQWFTKIFYNRSMDYGVTWSTEVDISKNDSIYSYQPKIVCNDTGRIFVTYDFNIYYSQVYLSIYENGQWSDPVLVSEGLPGKSYNNKAIVDNDGRFYVFWYNTTGFYYYKYLENGIWSDLICPFCNITGLHSLTDFAVDAYNNLHWIGGFPLQADPPKSKRTYYFYNKQEDTWDDPCYITNYYAKGIDKDIALDNDQNPHVAWREIEVAIIPEHDYTFYKYYDGENWTEQELVVEDPQNQQIAVDGYNNVHIVDREKTPLGSMQLVHYRKIDNQWVGMVIDTAGYAFFDVKLLCHNNMLFLSYVKNEQSGDSLPVYVTHYDVITSTTVNKEENLLPEYSLYPNPFSRSINIEFTTKTKSRVRIYIIDLQGRLVKEIENSILPEGKHVYSWDGTGFNNYKVSNASYLIRMYSDRQVITRAIQFIK
ncbi:MAG: T9SS type A sorting domain-containing protein [Bacteroidales bacterium]